MPLRHDTCHCGATRPASPLPADAQRATPPGGLGSLAALLLLAGVAALFYYGWPQRWYGAWTARVSLVTPTPVPSYPAVPQARSEVAEPERPLPPAVGEPAAPLPTPVEPPAPKPAAPGVRTFSGQGVPAAPEDRADAADEPGPLGAAQRRAVTKLTPRLVALDEMAEGLDGQLRQYVRACRQERLPALPAASGALRDWPVPLLLDPAVAPSREERASVDPAGCVILWDDIRAQAARLASALDDMRRLARAEGVLPGHVREALAEHRLDGWERYSPR